MFNAYLCLPINLLLGLVIIKYTDSIKCYQCNNCATVYDSVISESSCVQCITQFLYHGWIRRVCANSVRELPPYYDPKDTVIYCDTDLCNNQTNPQSYQSKLSSTSQLYTVTIIVIASLFLFTK
ncbi:hypothetical protein MN116_002947 [Schistosoma mekongi]|uniref:Uncharacterized protein n=1 Tax=Schistosoma mekongi TaxID=38744 RepID=A0AAE1ZH88_SCHME|nr:hypothetical protein MN116_002947 [Schistosoma mekongi]